MNKKNCLKIISSFALLFSITTFLSAQVTVGPGDFPAGSNTIWEVPANVFNIEVSNHYKIYSDIKNRSIERTKFLKKLVEDFQTKLEYDDGI